MNIYENHDIEKLLCGNPYVGRGIVAGKSEDGKKAYFVYFIMGRSENSRNRIFVKRGEDVEINAFDPSKLSDPSLIILSGESFGQECYCYKRRSDRYGL